ncbi:MAG: hypothetical protein ACYCQJ_03945 [Nitrososphaerales archaeon]
MAILLDGEKEEIRKRARMRAVDDKEYFNRVELEAAVEIIRKTLGSNWYERARNELVPPANSERPTDYNFLSKEQKLPPVTALLRGGLPGNYIRIINFARFIKSLYDSTNLKEKLAEYEKRERHSQISKERFDTFYFELKTASFLKRAGFEVTFVPERKKIPTPDLMIKGTNGIAWVECKKKDPQTAEQLQISNVCKSLEAQILNAMTKAKVNYAIDIAFDKKIEGSDIDRIITKFGQCISSSANEFSDANEHIHLKGKKLFDNDEVFLSSRLPPLPDLKNIEHMTWSAEIQNRRIDLFRVRESEVPIRNYKQVTISTYYVSSRIKSILNSLRDANQQIIASGHDKEGIAFVEIVLDQKMPPQIALKQILDQSDELMKEMSGLASVLYIVEQPYIIDDFTGLKSLAYGITNHNISCEVAKELEDQIRTRFTNDDNAMSSLLDD